MPTANKSRAALAAYKETPQRSVMTIRETEPELTAPGSQKAILYFLTIDTAPRYHLNSSSQVVLMPPHMVKGRVQPIS